MLFITLIILVGLYYKLKSNQEKNNAANNIPTITINIQKSQIPEQSKEYLESTEKIASQEKDFLDKESKVTELLKHLPHQGKNFSLSYDFKKLQFNLVLQKGRESEGNVEFNQFLQTYRILDRSWIRNLVITSQ